MTERERNDAIEYIKAYRKTDEKLHKNSPEGSVAFFATGTCLKYWDMAIKALEQIDVLDKIRAEISDIACYVNGEMMIEVVNLERVLEIIDKYNQSEAPNC